MKSVSEWTYDAESKTLIVGKRAYRLCSERRPIFGAYPIVRVGEHEWQIAPASYTLYGTFTRTADDFLRLVGVHTDISLQLTELL